MYYLSKLIFAKLFIQIHYSKTLILLIYITILLIIKFSDTDQKMLILSSILRIIFILLIFTITDKKISS